MRTPAPLHHEAWQACRQSLAAALGAGGGFVLGQARVRNPRVRNHDHALLCIVSCVILVRNLLGFAEDAILGLLTARRKTMLPRKR